jgi:O-acetyl-ADP-ribose deacetylase (regulator of RNase III)
MTTFVEHSGNLLESSADAVVNTVNTVGVMGKGIALQFKNAFPANFKAYERACKRDEVALGTMFVFDDGRLTPPHWIINFPTKGHWRSHSRISDVAAGPRRPPGSGRQARHAHSIALPPLGCGNGGLDWGEVRPLIEQRLDGLDLTVQLYVPSWGSCSGTFHGASGQRCPR